MSSQWNCHGESSVSSRWNCHRERREAAAERSRTIPRPSGAPLTCGYFLSVPFSHPNSEHQKCHPTGMSPSQVFESLIPAVSSQFLTWRAPEVAKDCRPTTESTVLTKRQHFRQDDL